MIEPAPAAPAARRLPCRLWPAAAAILYVSGAAVPAAAEVAVAGSMQAVRIEAHGSWTAEVLTALGAAFGLKYRTAVVLDRPVAGTFKGPVAKILARLLADYDYVVKDSAGRIEVVVIARAGKETDRVVSIYPDPAWRARTYSRSFAFPKPAFGPASFPGAQ